MEDDYRGIRCANCPSAAVAEVDGEPLCEGCLLALFLSSRDPELASRIRALRLRVHQLSPQPG